MSCVLSLTSAAIIAGISISTTVSTALLANVAEDNFDMDEGIETMFVNNEILLKTLMDEYDCHVNKVSDNEYEVVTSCGNLVYKRQNANEAYKLYLNKVEDVNGLLNNIKTFEVDYGRNVQAYTYNHIKENLQDNMTIEDEEVLEDDSLYLTININ